MRAANSTSRTPIAGVPFCSDCHCASIIPDNAIAAAASILKERLSRPKTARSPNVVNGVIATLEESYGIVDALRIVDGKIAVLQVAAERVPLISRVGRGLANQALG